MFNMRSIYIYTSGGVRSLGYDPRPTPSLLCVGMKLSDPDLLKTAEPLNIYTSGSAVFNMRCSLTGMIDIRHQSTRQ
jgi:hypothetical protein